MTNKPEVSPAMTAEERVKKVYEYAESFNIYAHVCGVFKQCNEEAPIGVGITESDAWADAASRLPDSLQETPLYCICRGLPPKPSCPVCNPDWGKE